MEIKNPKVWDIERLTQNRVIDFMQSELWYTYLWNREEEERTTCVEEDRLKSWLKKQNKYSDDIINSAVNKLIREVSDQQKQLYYLNKDVYTMLRYWQEVKQLWKQSVRVHFFDWDNIENNEFAIAEEVTVLWEHTKRPDIVIYVNWIALWVLELKRSKVSVSEWIRQNLDNQKKEFIKNFFATIQLVMAGNDTQWLYYWTIETPEKYYLQWKESTGDTCNHDGNVNEDKVSEYLYWCMYANKLDKELFWMLRKERLMDLVHNFVVFDAGVKKLCRHNQYFAVKEAQKFLRRREWWIIWHTQWSGKSLTMVWLAKWIRENITDSRVFLITDREELDEQIEKVFNWVDENIYRTKSWKDLLAQIWWEISRWMTVPNTLVASLVHKFWRQYNNEDTPYDEYIKEIKNNLPADFKPFGDIYVFVDECHRTQTGKLHKAMKEILPNSVFIWFTWTPLLKRDKRDISSNETFGKYIHTYKFDEAIQDNVVLDLRYEARNVDQNLTSQDKVDAWFEAKTRWLSDIAVAKLKQTWWTMQNVLSSEDRLEKIVQDILLDFEIKPRLQLWRWNAMLVAWSIYEACKYYDLFIKAWFTKCAVVSSYKPTVASIKWTTTWEDEISDDITKYETYRKMIANYFNITEDEASEEKRIEEFEKDVKKKFVKEPWQMRLLIVVDKLLTWFDAPSATYLYIDKSMQDHWLFQAICRVNRLDDKAEWDEFDKDYWYIVDYKDLFKSLQSAITDYTNGAFEEFDEEDIKWLLKNRLEDCKKKLEEVREKVHGLIEWVKYPQWINEYMDYFVWDIKNEQDRLEKQELRNQLYKCIASYNRAYMNLANDMREAWYTDNETQEIKDDVKHFTDLRVELMNAASDYIDLRRLNAAMRYMIDTYIQASDSQVIAKFEDTTLLEMIAKDGIDKAIASLPKAIRENDETVAETIERNIRTLLVDKQSVNPVYFQKMSFILNELVKKRKEQSIEYQEYLKQIAELAKLVINKEDPDNKYPDSIKWSDARKALYDNLDNDEETAIALDTAIRQNKQHWWRWNTMKKKMVKRVIKWILWDDELTDRIFNIVEQQNEY